MPASFSQPSNTALLDEIDLHINHAASPTMAMTLLNQRRVLEDRLRFQTWLQESDLLLEQRRAEERQQQKHADDDAPAHHFSRRLQGRICAL